MKKQRVLLSTTHPIPVAPCSVSGTFRRFWQVSECQGHPHWGGEVRTASFSCSVTECPRSGIEVEKGQAARPALPLAHDVSWGPRVCLKEGRNEKYILNPKLASLSFWRILCFSLELFKWQIRVNILKSLLLRPQTSKQTPPPPPPTKRTDKILKSKTPRCSG